MIPLSESSTAGFVKAQLMLVPEGEWVRQTKLIQDLKPAGQQDVNFYYDVIYALDEAGIIERRLVNTHTQVRLAQGA